MGISLWHAWIFPQHQCAVFDAVAIGTRNDSFNSF